MLNLNTNVNLITLKLSNYYYKNYFKTNVFNLLLLLILNTKFL